MYINYNTVRGVEYATATRSVRNGKTTVKADQVYLGRVIDKERCIFKNRKLGLFIYDVHTGKYDKVPPEFVEPPKERKTKYAKRDTLIVSFGDIYVLDQFLKKSGFETALNAIGYRNQDTLHALFAYYLLSSHANSHAEDWYQLTYAKYLYPKAQLSSQRISDALVDIGSEDAKRNFFKAYTQFLEKRDNVNSKTTEIIDDGILIDSSGMPNAIHTNLTMISNHNGVISEEIRLIYVVQQHTGMPLFFRYVAGNVIDVSTITRTIAELKANGVNTKFAILDAGYYTEVNADALFEAGVSFMTRLKPNLVVYKEIVKDNLDKLEAKENLVRFGRRLVYIKCVPCKVGTKRDKSAYAYLCKDLTMQHQLQKKLIQQAEDEDKTGSELYDDLQKQGLFVLISSRKIAVDKVLQTYYTRDQIEKIFEICKQDSKLLPLNVESEESFRGHLMMTFMVTAMVKLMSDHIASSGLTPETAFMNLHEQHAIVYDDELITCEPQKQMNDAYKAFKVTCPATIPR